MMFLAGLVAFFGLRHAVLHHAPEGAPVAVEA